MPISSFFKGLQNMWVGTDQVYQDLYIPGLINGTNFDALNKAESVSSVYICVKILAETLSRLPLNVYIENEEGKLVDKNDYRYPILHYNPNGYMSQQTFISALEYWRNLKGNAYARIWRNKQYQVTSLELIPPSRVMGYSVVNNELYYTIKDEKDKEITLNNSDILHFKSLTKDGILGINPIEAIRLNVSSTWQGLQTIDSFYKNNATSPRAIKSTISGANQKAMLDAIAEFKTKYSGAVNAGQMIALPPNTDIVDLALNFADAMFVETLHYNSQQIAALYGVPAWMVGEMTQTKYSSIEATMLEFKATTLANTARMYRQEFESKLLSTQERLDGKTIEFNTMALLETDSTTRINNLRTLASLGAISLNAVAINEGYPTFKNGEYHYAPLNYGAIEQKKPAPEAPTTTQ